MTDETAGKTYTDGLEDAARVCEFIASRLSGPNLSASRDALKLAADAIRKYEPGFLLSAGSDTDGRA